MVKWCVVRNCKSGSKVESKCSMFRVPRDTEMWKKWEEAIPGIVKLSQTDIVCEKHFEADDISREWIKLDADGRLIARATYKCPKLKKHAVPTKFDPAAASPGEKNCVRFHEYAKRFSNTRLIVPEASDRSNFSMNSTIVSRDTEISGDSLIFSDTSKRLIAASIDSSASQIEASLSPINVSSCEAANSSPHCDIIDEPSSPKINEPTQEGNETGDAELSARLPDSWSIGKFCRENKKYTYFSYTTMKFIGDDTCPVIQKCVTLDASDNLKYFVHGRRVYQPEMRIQSVLRDREELRGILEKFQWTRVCYGLGESDMNVARYGEAYRDHLEKWRSKDCRLLSRMKRCDSCVKLRRCMEQRAARLRKTTIKRITGDFSNPADRRKIVEMRKKIRRERCRNIRAKLNCFSSIS